MKVIKKEKTVDHPLEEFFDIEEQTTVVEYTEILPVEIPPSAGYDEKDDDIETKIEEVYTAAMGQVAAGSDAFERAEGKYKARLSEVTAAMLNVALGAIREKSSLKQHKDKLGATIKAGSTPRTLNQNLIVADRNEILRLMAEQPK